MFNNDRNNITFTFQNTFCPFAGLVPSDYSQVPVTTRLAMPLQASTPPPILRRGTKVRRRKNSLTPMEEDVVVSQQLPCDIKHELLEDDDDDDSGVRPLASSPIRLGTTPIKQLPFSPSQFLNSPNLTFDVQLASTPVKQHVQASTPQKEKIKPVSFFLQTK